MSARLLTWAWRAPLASGHGSAVFVQRLVLLCLVDHAGPDGVAWPSVATIVTLTGLSRRTVQMALAALEAQGLIVAVGGRRGGGRTTTRWQVRPPTGDSDRPSGAADAPLGAQELHPSQELGAQELHGRGAAHAARGAGAAPNPLDPLVIPSISRQIQQGPQQPAGRATQGEGQERRPSRNGSAGPCPHCEVMAPHHEVGCPHAPGPALLGDVLAAMTAGRLAAEASDTTTWPDRGTSTIHSADSRQQGPDDAGEDG